MNHAVRRPAAMFGAALLLLCGAGGTTAQPAGDVAGWNQGVYNSCVPSAVQNGATSQGAQNYCACVVRQLDQLPAQERAGLDANSPEISRAADVCRPLAQTGVAADDASADAWDRSTYASCVPSAMQTGASAQGARRYCSCVVAELDELPEATKLALTTSSPELDQAADQCRPLAH